jgi:hypothetical protein
MRSWWTTSTVVSTTVARSITTPRLTRTSVRTPARVMLQRSSPGDPSRPSFSSR